MSKVFTAYDDLVLSGLMDDYLENPHNTDLIGLMGDRLEDLQQLRLLSTVRALARMHENLPKIAVPETDITPARVSTAVTRSLRTMPWISRTVKMCPTLPLLYYSLCLRWLPLRLPAKSRRGNGVRLPLSLDPVMPADRYIALLQKTDQCKLAFMELACTGLLGSASRFSSDMQRRHAQLDPEQPNFAEWSTTLLNRPERLGHVLVNAIATRASNIPMRIVRLVCYTMGYQSTHNKMANQLLWWLNEAVAQVALAARCYA